LGSDGQFSCFTPIGCFSHDAHIGRGLDQSSKRFAHNLLAVSDKNTNFHPEPGSPLENTRQSRTKEKVINTVLMPYGGWTGLN
jgi:hypothetical protein